MARHWQLEHTADIGVAAEASSFEALLEELSKGLFEIIVDPRTVRGQREYPIGKVEADTREDLIISWLSELLYVHETQEAVFSRFEVKSAGPLAVTGKAFGEPADPERHTPLAVVKAATYHRLKVEQGRGVWRAAVYLDV